jgi:TolB-like protein
MRSALLLVLAAGLLATPALAQDDDKPSLLIMAFTADGVPGRSATSAEDLTASAFSRTGRFNVIAGADLEQMMQLESNKAALGCTEGECIAEIADALGADYVVTGRISRLGELYVLKLSVLRPSEAKTMVTETFNVKSIEDLAFELSMAGQRMTLITFGEEVPDALKVTAEQQKQKSDEEVQALVDEAVQKTIEEQETDPLVLTLIYGGLGATGIGAVGFVVTTAVMVGAYVLNGIWITSPGFVKGIARPTGLIFSLIQPLFIVVALGGLTSLTFGYILE